MKLLKAFLLAVSTKKLYFFWLPRLFGLLLIPGFIFDVEILILFQALLFLHANIGLEVILEDYLHVETIKLQCLSLIKLLNIMLINLSILYLL